MDVTEQNINIRGSFCIEEIPRPAGFIIFGASGDLTFRKLIPSLFYLFKKNLLSNHFYLIGCARTCMDDNTFRINFLQFYKITQRMFQKKLRRFSWKVIWNLIKSSKMFFQSIRFIVLIIIWVKKLYRIFYFFNSQILLMMIWRSHGHLLHLFLRHGKRNNKV